MLREGRVLCAFSALIVCCLLGAIAPVLASAATFQVDSAKDQADAAPGDGLCLTAADTCTLRAAIEESNATGAGTDSIVFGPAFDGKPTGTIAVASPLPPVTAPLDIDGVVNGRCTTAAGFLGPCAGVDGPAGETGLVVNSSGVSVEGLAITGATTGITVDEQAEGFRAAGNWIGVRLDGASGANGTGIRLSPGVGGVLIGGDTAEERNVISDNAEDGLDVVGAHGAIVSGDYFGVGPGGDSAAANGTDIELADQPPSGPNAVDNVIGGELTSQEAVTQACDGPCNVISGSLGAGVDLSGSGTGEARASGPTTIRGNYIGLGASGAGAVPNGGPGVLVGSALNVTIGGARLPEDSNHINGGSTGITSGRKPEHLDIEGNMIGLDPAGTATLTPPRTFGIFDDAEGQFAGSEATRISNNRFAMFAGEAIRQQGSGAEIVANAIGQGVDGSSLPGATVGIHLIAAADFPSVVEGNLIRNSGAYGVLVQNSHNSFRNNVIRGAGTNGILILGLPAGLEFGGVFAGSNQIGEDAQGTGNVVDDSGSDAIALSGPLATFNLIARLSGNGNRGKMIAAPGVERPLISARPMISTATSTFVRGMSSAGGVIRVYEKASSAPGELRQYLGATEANSKGAWSFAYPMPLPNGTFVAASFTGILNTSELDIAAVGAGPPKTSISAPKTSIFSAPKPRSEVRVARFEFRSSESASTFQCRLDRAHFSACRSPRIYRHLQPGRHVFRVRAIDRDGRIDQTPAERTFRVLP
jgi:CSLREA domain-containing protein